MSDRGKHSERGVTRQAANIRPGHVIQWCGRGCRVLSIARPPQRGRRRWVRLTVEVPNIGECTLNYETAERVRVLDFDDPRLDATMAPTEAEATARTFLSSAPILEPRAARRG